MADKTDHIEALMKQSLIGDQRAYADLFSGQRPDLMVKLHEPWFVIEILALVCIFISTSVSAALLSFPDMYQKPKLASSPVIMFAIFVWVMFLA